LLTTWRNRAACPDESPEFFFPVGPASSAGLQIEKAKAVGAKTERERDYIAAIEAFYKDFDKLDHRTRAVAYEKAMEKVYLTYSKDREAAIFYALALLGTALPTDKTYANQKRAADILNKVLPEEPEHPGVAHYLIHSFDYPQLARLALPAARSYAKIAPASPHALHMPSHIFTRLGLWDESIQSNIASAAAAARHVAKTHPGAASFDQLHAMDYLVYAYLQKGDNKAAAAQIRRLRTTERLEPSFKTAFHLMSTEARYTLERRAWKEAAVLVPREPSTLDWDRFTWPEAIVRFARGLGAAHLGRLDQAKAERQRLNELETATVQMHEDLFARNIRMLRLELEGWIAHVEGKEDVAVSLMREAADLEESTPKAPVTPGPTLPAEELIGDLFMERKQPAKALPAYQRSLELYPHRRHSVLGAARATALTRDVALSKLSLIHRPVR